MVSRPSDWFKQALKDLNHAKKSLKLGDYKRGYSAAHQATEKVVKALYQKPGLEVWRHSVSRLL